MDNMMTFVTDDENVIDAAMDTVIDAPKVKSCAGKTLIGAGIGFIAGVVTCKVVVPAIKKIVARKINGDQAVSEIETNIEIKDIEDIEDLDDEN